MAKPTRKQVAAYLDPEEICFLDALAKRDGLARADVLRIAFRRLARAEGLLDPAKAPGATENAA